MRASFGLPFDKPDSAALVSADARAAPCSTRASTRSPSPSTCSARPGAIQRRRHASAPTASTWRSTSPWSTTTDGSPSSRASMVEYIDPTRLHQRTDGWIDVPAPFWAATDSRTHAADLAGAVRAAEDDRIERRRQRLRPDAACRDRGRRRRPDASTHAPAGRDRTIEPSTASDPLRRDIAADSDCHRGHPHRTSGGRPDEAPTTLSTTAGSSGPRSALRGARRRAAAYRPVTLPHDAMIQQRARPDGAAGRRRRAYFPGGAFEYRKTLRRAARSTAASGSSLEFEGVYRDAMVYVNGDFAGQRPYGYSRVPRRRGPRSCASARTTRSASRPARTRTPAGTPAPASTATPGCSSASLVHIAPDGVRVTTPDIDAERAVVEVATTVENDIDRDPDARRRHRDPRRRRARSSRLTRVPITVLPGEPATARQRLYVPRPAAVEPGQSPALYTAPVTSTRRRRRSTDAETVAFGIRTLQARPEHGLRINGETVKLRGACIHHDNGVLGAATFARAEERRVAAAQGGRLQRDPQRPTTR